MRYLFFALALTAVSSPLMAQDLGKSLHACFSVKDDPRRLACYDALARAATKPNAKSDAWREAAKLAMADYGKFQSDIDGTTDCVAGFPREFKRRSQPAVGGDVVVDFTRKDSPCAIVVYVSHLRSSIYSVEIQPMVAPAVSYEADLSNGALEKVAQ